MTSHLLSLMIVAAIMVKSSGMMLLQSGSSFLRKSSAGKGADEVVSCAPLENQQTFFAVTVSVGTPAQNFSLVADTGSDSLLIPSCFCVESGYCYTGPEGKCFTGSNSSSTFRIRSHKDGPATAILTYGSGAIKVVLSSDVVKVGNVQTYMHDGVLLMTDEALDFSSAFQGILGLGPPSRTPVGQMIHGDGNISYDESKRNETRDEALKQMQGDTSGVAVRPLDAAINHQRSQGQHLSKSFLREAGIEKFSVCFNPLSDGVLRLNAAAPPDALNSLGGMHWGFDLQGITVGASTKKLNFCQAANKTNASQITACAAIPDSGTTVMAGPSDHLVMVIEGLCDNWQRCTDLHAKVAQTAEQVKDTIDDQLGGYNPWNVAPLSKAEMFLALIDDCHSWLQNGSDLSEMPNLDFHVGDLNGTKKTLQIPPSAYIIEMEQSDEDNVYMFANGLFRERLRQLREQRRRLHNGTGDYQGATTICAPAFEPMDYETPENGPVWILGMPLFYQYQVHYNQNATNPTIGFSQEPCGSCGSGGISSSVPTANMQLQGERSRTLFPRKISKPLRSKVLHKTTPF